MEESFSKRFKWRIEAWAHTVVAFLVGQLPPETVFVFGEFVGKAIWPLMKGRQRTIARNLRIAGGSGVGKEGIEESAKRNFIRTTANLVSSSVSANLSPERFGEILEVENPELLEDAVAKGNGVILLLAHMGNWELLTRLHRLFPEGTKSGAFYRPLNNPILNERILKEREADGTRLFSKRDSLHHVSGFLRENGVIGILADQRVAMQGEVVPFFGRITRASPLPSLLARRCKSVVLSLSLRTVAPGKWSARYHAVEKPYDTANCMEALERAMRVSLNDVFWLQERWKVYVAAGIPFLKWFGGEEERGRLPHRALIWKKAEELKIELPAALLHGDIEYETSVGRTAHELVSIDLEKDLPIDCLVCFSEDAGLRSEAKRLGIPVLMAGDFLE